MLTRKMFFGSSWFYGDTMRCAVSKPGGMRSQVSAGFEPLTQAMAAMMRFQSLGRCLDVNQNLRA
jgi:hypothetical protein